MLVNTKMFNIIVVVLIRLYRERNNFKFNYLRISTSFDFNHLLSNSAILLSWNLPKSSITQK